MTKFFYFTRQVTALAAMTTLMTGCLFDKGTKVNSSSSTTTSPSPTPSPSPSPVANTTVSSFKSEGPSLARPGDCFAVKLRSYNSSNALTPVSETLTFTSNNSLQIYSDNTCSTSTTSLSFPMGSSEITFYVKGDMSGRALSLTSGTFQVSDLLNVLWATKVIAGGGHTCALLNDSSARCWGLNESGQLGDGTMTSSMTPVIVRGNDGLILNNIKDLALGYRHSCALMTSGKVLCWGRNTSYQLGNGSQTLSIVPTPVKISGSSELANAIQLASGASSVHTCAVIKNSEVSQTIKCWGSGANGRLGVNSTSSQSYATDLCTYNATLTPSCPNLPPIATQVAAGEFHSCALFSDKSVWCWGYNGEGALGNNTYTDSLVAVQTLEGTSTALANAEKIVAGTNASCAMINNAGTKQIKCWGSAARAGDWTYTGRKIAGVVKNSSSVEVSTATDITTGKTASCAALSNNHILCWGANSPGFYLVDSSLGVALGEDVGVTDAQTLSIGETQLCYVTTSGDVKCLGQNSQWNLGSTSVNTSSPTEVADTSAYKTFNLSSTVNCGLLNDATGTLKCWGWNGNGHMGFSPSTTFLANVPTTVTNGINDSTANLDVTNGSGHTCVLKADNSVKCWGVAGNGRLGNHYATGTSQNVVTAVKAPLPTAIVVDASNNSYVAGDFASYGGASGSNRLVKLDSTGVKASTFNTVGTSFNGGIYSLALQTDGKLLVAGEFTKYNSTTVSNLVRLNTDGSLDSTFNVGTGFNGPIYKVRVLTDGSILAGGEFTTVNGDATHPYIVKLTSTGGISSSFTATADGAIGVIEVQSDTNILLAGAFSMVNSTARSRIARVTSAGVLDSTFNAGTVSLSTGAASYISIAAIQTDGKILIAGKFDTLTIAAATTRKYLARLNSDGSVDTTFTVGTGFDMPPNSVQLLTQGANAGKILIGGGFTTYNGTALGGRLVRLTTAGAIDSTFPTNNLVNYVTAMQLLSNDTAMIVGAFTKFGSTANVNRIAKVNTDGTRDTTFVAASPTFASAFGNISASANVQATAISAGDSHTCVIDTENYVACWGYGLTGRLGNNALEDVYAAVYVVGPSGFGRLRNANQISAALSHTCARIGNNALCWGANPSGQLGDNTGITSYIPVWVKNRGNTGVLATVLSISTANSASCAVTSETDAPAQCWGDNSSFALGDGTSASRNRPVAVLDYPSGPSMRNVTEIATGTYFTCARKSTGEVLCWGLNDKGYIGNGDVSGYVNVPTQVAIPSATKLYSGSTSLNIIAVSGGKYKIWGTNEKGLLGSGQIQTAWVLVDGLFN